MPKPGQITRAQAIKQVVETLSTPISFDDFADRVLAIAPSTAKSPRGAVRTEIRFFTIQHGLIFMDNRRTWLAPARAAMCGVRFRHTITRWEAENGVIIVNEDFTPFFPGHRYEFEKVMKNDLRLLDEAGEGLSFTVGIKQIRAKDPLLGEFTETHLCLNLPLWFLQQNVTEGDSILFTIEQWQPPVWEIEHEPVALRNQPAIAARNEELAEILFEILEAEQSERVYLVDTLPPAILRVSDPYGYPGDPWTEVIQTDGRMRYSEMDICYADGQGNLFEEFARSLLPKEEEEEDGDDDGEPLPELSEEQAKQVYRFKAWLVDDTKLWRRIEILGEQTLEELNQILITAFKHDWDHMAGFWRLIQRGNSKRYREVEIGMVHPFGEDDNSDIRIADLELTVNALIKYIFDFGDNHEHHLKLEEILPAAQWEPNTEYPRIVEQNKPEYQYCQHCQKKNKQVIATHYCYECSDSERKPVVICEKCATRYHEDHYTVEMVY